MSWAYCAYNAGNTSGSSFPFSMAMACSYKEKASSRFPWVIEEMMKSNRGASQSQLRSPKNLLAVGNGEEEEDWERDWG
jgi:hypothetical protein